MQNELDSANNTLSTLHAQLMDLQQSDTIFRVKQNHEESVSSLRERHEKELFRLHQEINKLSAEKKSQVSKTYKEKHPLINPWKIRI